MGKMVRGIIGKSGVYGLEINGEIVYIGSSGSNMESRKSNHLAKLRKGDHISKLQERYDEFDGVVKFKVIEYCDAKDTYKRELHYMKLYKDTILNHNDILDLEKKIRTGKEATEHRRKYRSMMQGSKNPNCKFMNDKSAAEIIWLKNNTDMSNKEIAEIYKIPNDNYISRIGVDRWKHVTTEVKPSWYIDKKETNTLGNVEASVVNL